MPLFANQVKLCAWIRKFVAWAVDFRGIMFFAITKSCIFSFVQMITQEQIALTACLVKCVEKFVKSKAIISAFIIVALSANLYGKSIQ